VFPQVGVVCVTGGASYGVVPRLGLEPRLRRF
jgi:hypothetical protein